VGAAQAPEGERLFLGVDAQDTPYFAVLAEESTADKSTEDSGRLTGVREVVHLLSELDAALLMTAVALGNWHGRHRYAPASGQLTTVREGVGYAPTRPARICGRVPIRPSSCWCTTACPASRPVPARAQRELEPGRGTRRAAAVLVPGRLRRAGRIGEQTAVREVAEEVGVRATDLRYVSSQPWPYPGSLMLGFLARADPAAPLRWSRPRSRRRSGSPGPRSGRRRGRPDIGFAISPPSSIAHFLITTWLAG